MKSKPSPSPQSSPASGRGGNREKQFSILAALTVSLTGSVAPAELRLLPAGNFKAADGSGRPVGIASGWLMNEAIAQKLVALASSRTSDYAIDYEHQTLLSAENGQPAPAAGWFKQLEWRSGDGLYAMNVRWTERAAALIAAQEYRYLSPVFAYHPKTGAVTGLGPAALTNNPGLDGLTDLAALSSLISTTENLMDVDELLNNFRYWLNLPALSTQEEVLAAIQKATDLIKSSGAAETVAASALGVVGALTAQYEQIAALKAAAPDPAKFAPVAVMQSLQTELAQLRAENNQREVDSIVTTAIKAGNMHPELEAWAREHGKSDLVSLKAFVAKSPALAALTGTQTKGKAPDGTQAGTLDDNELAMCRSMGITAEDFLKTKGGSQSPT